MGNASKHYRPVNGKRQGRSIRPPQHPYQSIILTSGFTLSDIAVIDPDTREFIKWKTIPPLGSLADQLINRRRGQSRGKYRS